MFAVCGFGCTFPECLVCLADFFYFLWWIAFVEKAELSRFWLGGLS